MAESRGSILISTANEIGGSLVNKLGGDGYAPKDWSDNINLLGISEVDSEAAISALKESQGSRSRGSILISTANKIGATLNKKYSTERGFKPCEWASAISKMKALETDTKSGGIVNIKGAKEVPTLSLVGTINPNLDGVETLSATRLGKNIIYPKYEGRTNAGITYTVNEDHSITCQGIASSTSWVATNLSTQPDKMMLLRAGTYFLTGGISSTIRLYLSGIGVDGSSFYSVYDSGNGALYTLTKDYYVYPQIRIDSGVDLTDPITINIQLEVDSEATEYTPYEEPTVYSADLGRTIYGGSADIVKGEGVDANSAPVTFVGASSENWQFSLSGTKQRVWIYIADAKASSNKLTGNIIASDSNMSGYPDEGKAWVNSSKSLVIGVPSSITSANDWKTYLSNNNLQVTYELATPEPFTFDPIEVLTSGEVENFYTSAGDTSIEYYAAPTPYTRGTASGAIASFSGANTEFPFTKLKANIAPSVDGVSSVDVYNEESTVYSADLGETVYGGSVDLVSGEVKSEYAADTMTSEYLSRLNSDYIGYESSTAYFGGHSSVWVRNWNYQRAAARKAGGIGCTCNYFPVSMNNTTIFSSQYRIYIDVNGKNISSVQDFIDYVANIEQGGNSLEIAFELATPSEFSIDGQVIFPNEGVNNVSNSAGGNTEVEYFIAE